MNTTMSEDTDKVLIDNPTAASVDSEAQQPKQNPPPSPKSTRESLIAGN